MSPTALRERVSSGRKRQPTDPRLSTSSARRRAQPFEALVARVQRDRVPDDEHPRTALQRRNTRYGCALAQLRAGMGRGARIRSATSAGGAGALAVVTTIAAMSAAPARQRDRDPANIERSGTLSDRLLHEAIRQRGDDERHGQPNCEQGPAGQMRTRLVDHDVDRPMPEIHAVADEPQHAQRPEREQAADRPAAADGPRPR